MEYKIKAHSLLTDFDVYLFRSGKHIRLYEKMGSHLMELDGEAGCYLPFLPRPQKCFGYR